MPSNALPLNSVSACYPSDHEMQSTSAMRFETQHHPMDYSVQYEQSPSWGGCGNMQQAQPSHLPQAHEEAMPLNYYQSGIHQHPVSMDPHSGPMPVHDPYSHFQELHQQGRRHHHSIKEDEDEGCTVM